MSKMLNSDPGGFQHGLTLVELMVSLVLGLTLSSGIISVYLESKRNFAAEEELARIQENGRFAISLLKREIMQAGFTGGYLSFTGMNKISISKDCDTNWALDLDTPVDFINNFSSTRVALSGDDLNCLDEDEVQPGTDVLSIKRTAGEPTAYAGVLLTGATAKKNQIYLRVKNYGDEKTWYRHTSTNPLPGLGPKSSIEYWEMYSRLYYIRRFSSQPGDGVPTLCVRELVDNAMTERCYVEGVENMQIVFGMDDDFSADGVPDQYLMDPDDLNAVVTVSVFLLMRSLMELAGTAVNSVKSFKLGADPNTIDTDDRYLRRIFSTTVQMRNAIVANHG